MSKKHTDTGGRNEGEFELIQQAFIEGSPDVHPLTILANGDDASVHEVPEDLELVVSTDASIAGVHWPAHFPLQTAAEKAICAALSDLAAMGAEACWAWVTVMAHSAADIKAMGAGVNAALNRYNVELAGGDTTSSPVNGLNITVAGMVPRGKAMRRDKAKPHDRVWMIGKAGFSSLGLQQWLAEMKEGYFKRYFEEIKPKLERGLRIRELGVRCCIDISDGLLQDANHIATASEVGMELELSSCPGWDILCHKVGENNAIKAIAGGGEDYALLFTAPLDMCWLDSVATCIGKCSDEEGVRLMLRGSQVEALSSGYDHFA